MSRVAAALSAVVFMLVSSSARPDAIPPPPTNCPAGTLGESDHNCDYCAPTICSACKTGTTCQAAKLCVETVTCANRGGTWTKSHYSSACPSGSCTKGACQSVNVCLPAADSGQPATGPTPGRGCSCALAAPTAAGELALIALIAAVALIAVRTRRRSK